MYKIYLKIFNEQGFSEIVTDSRTTTPCSLAAESAFRELICRKDLIGKLAHAVLSLDSRQLMYHRFDRSPGEADYVEPNAEIKLFHDD